LSSLPLVNLWAKRAVILHFALMNIKIRFKGTYLGFAWNALEPTLTFVILYIVFTTIRERPGENFAMYLLSGILIYHVFIRGTNAGLSSLTTNKGILLSLKINREFFPVVATAATSLLLLIEVGVLFVLMPFFDFIPPWTIFLLPILFGLVILFVLGLSYILSIIHVYVPDIHQYNPVGQLIELGHKLIVFGQIPPLTEWLHVSLFAFGFFIFGYVVFRKFERRIVEEL